MPSGEACHRRDWVCSLMHTGTNLTHTYNQLRRSFLDGRTCSECGETHSGGSWNSIPGQDNLNAFRCKPHFEHLLSTLLTGMARWQVPTPYERESFFIGCDTMREYESRFRSWRAHCVREEPASCVAPNTPIPGYGIQITKGGTSVGVLDNACLLYS